MTEDNQLPIVVHEHFSQLGKLQVTFAVSKLLLTFQSTVHSCNSDLTMAFSAHEPLPTHTILISTALLTLGIPSLSCILTPLSTLTWAWYLVPTPSGSSPQWPHRQSHLYSYCSGLSATFWKYLDLRIVFSHKNWVMKFRQSYVSLSIKYWMMFTQKMDICCGPYKRLLGSFHQSESPYTLNGNFSKTSLLSLIRQWRQPLIGYWIFGYNFFSRNMCIVISARVRHDMAHAKPENGSPPPKIEKQDLH